MAEVSEPAPCSGVSSGRATAVVRGTQLGVSGGFTVTAMGHSRSRSASAARDRAAALARSFVEVLLLRDIVGARYLALYKDALSRAR